MYIPTWIIVSIVVFAVIFLHAAYQRATRHLPSRKQQREMEEAFLRDFPPDKK